MAQHLDHPGPVVGEAVLWVDATRPDPGRPALCVFRDVLLQGGLGLWGLALPPDATRGRDAFKADVEPPVVALPEAPLIPGWPAQVSAPDPPADLPAPAHLVDHLRWAKRVRPIGPLLIVVAGPGLNHGPLGILQAHRHKSLLLLRRRPLLHVLDGGDGHDLTFN